MPTAAFVTLGCKVNQYETQRILDDFEARGFGIAAFNTAADVYVINSCSVTQAAERKSRYMIRKLAHQNPDAIVVLTGCYGEMAQIKGETCQEAHLVVPNHRKMDTLRDLLSAYPELQTALDCSPAHTTPSPAYRRNRVTLKVQDGCDVFCTFCSIPYTRKVMVSRPLDELIAEAETRVSQGYREIVVTGVLVGAYAQEEHPQGILTSPAQSGRSQWAFDRSFTRPDLADLLLRLAQVKGIERVRLSSIEPTQVTARLLNAFATEPRLCRHLHIPLQSGDSDILNAMNRPYDQAFYLDRCLSAYACIPDLAITSDIMVGFPGEDRRAFENTLDVVNLVGFARAHLFRYSARPGTPAANFGNQVPEQEKQARSLELAEACRTAQQRFIRRYMGRVMEVLAEGKEGECGADAAGGASGNDEHSIVEDTSGASSSGLLSGYTSNYIRVQFVGSARLMGQISHVMLTEPTRDGAMGDIGGAHFGPLEAPADAEFIPLTTFAGTL